MSHLTVDRSLAKATMLPARGKARARMIVFIMTIASRQTLIEEQARYTGRYEELSSARKMKHSREGS